MDAEQVRLEIVAKLGQSWIDDMQSDINRMKKMPQYEQYVAQRKLHLIDSNYQLIDNLLTLGILK
jgi:hypothetical protein